MLSLHLLCMLLMHERGGQQGQSLSSWRAKAAIEMMIISYQCPPHNQLACWPAYVGAALQCQQSCHLASQAAQSWAVHAVYCAASTALAHACMHACTAAGCQLGPLTSSRPPALPGAVTALHPLPLLGSRQSMHMGTVFLGMGSVANVGLPYWQLAFTFLSLSPHDCCLKVQ